MLKVAILDDYQNVAQEFIDLKNLSSKFDIEIFSEPFENEDDAIAVSYTHLTLPTMDSV